MKLGVIGSGMIVPEFLDNCIKYSDIKLISILSTKRSIEKAKNIAYKYGVKNTYHEFDEFLNSDIDTVYIGIPNHMHYEYGKKCLLSGKNVIMEKPFTQTVSEACELIGIARKNNLFILEAISNQFTPNYEKLSKLTNDLGDIKIIQLNFSQYSSRYDAFKQGILAPVFDKDKGGGSLVDLGVYNIYFVVGLFGEPKDVHYYPNIERGVDTSGILIMDYDTFKCVCVHAKDCKAPLSINIQGDKACIYSNDPSNDFTSFTFSQNNGEEVFYSLNEDHHRLFYEVGAFLELYKNRDVEKIKKLNENTITVMKIIEKALT